MHSARFSASAGEYHGELRATEHGLEFVPVSLFDGLQMCLGVNGWRLAWDEIAGIERVNSWRGLSRHEGGGVVRVHYDAYARFVTILLRDPLDDFLAAADVAAAAAARSRDVA